ncbi:long-chain-fatty-acid--CoA ligase [Pseudochrobactrum sp. sp1633]|uniref:long-chain-fatty-acid--CoA ligase n=1 Tax=Pseudochrobactrum sp. sp1633 TaxID=3036706 RepID=UPI0025A61767|nr:long-chain-fatty-acid--CoA ligase [Pseudochrobactrum sp. sp1633]
MTRSSDGNAKAGATKSTAKKAGTTAAKSAEVKPVKETAAKKTTATKAAPVKAAPKTAAKKADAAANTTKVKAPAKPATESKAAAKTTPKKVTTKAAATKPAVVEKKSDDVAVTAASSKKTAPAAQKAAVRSSPYDAKPWLNSYPQGVAHQLEPSPYQSIADLILTSCKKYGDRPAFTCMDKSLSYKELDEKSEALAAWLQSRGLVKGDRVAVMMPNVLQYPIAITAILRAGLVVVNVNPLYTPRELEHQLSDAGAKAIIILENFAHTLEKVLANSPVKHVIVASMGDMHGLKGALINFVVRRVKKMVPAWNIPAHNSFKSVLASGAKQTLKPVSIAPDDLAFLQYTGGTTGISKGAMLMQSNILANVEQMRLWLDVAFRRKGRPENISYICALPLYHIFALTVNAMMGIQQGARNVLIPNPRDIPAFVKELQKAPFHIFPGLNTLFNALMENADFRRLDFKPLILTLGGGMAVQRPVAERWEKMTGCLITEGYGLSETSPVATANVLDATEFSGTIGLPVPGSDVAIRDDDGNDVPLGEVGEVCVRGPQVMKGYWNRQDETAKAIFADGFFRTGDMGFMNEAGFTKIVDRKKDMILVSGFNVYPNEIEEVAAEHPGVVEAAAIGIANEHSGEVVKLFVVRRDPELTEEALKAFCAERLTNYKRPRMIEFRDSLPKSNVGKILRRELR